MNVEQFEKIFEARVSKIRDLLVTKAKEYASDSDRLYNFKRGAQINNVHPCTCLDWYLTKHLVSYKDIVEKIQRGEKIDMQLVDDKLGDILTYFFLQESLMHECDAIHPFTSVPKLQ